MEKINIIVPNDVLDLINLFKSYDKELYIVGGAVRDYLIGKQPIDYDFCTNALPNELIKILDGYKLDTFSLNLGNIKVIINVNIYAITTLRKEQGMINGRYPKQIEFVNDINIDLQRRDFTINAMALGYNDGFYLIDPLNGIEDIKNKYIRFIGDPEVRIKEDPIRILRAIKFMLRLEFNISLMDLAAIFEHASLVKELDNNFKYKELLEILSNKNIDKHLMIYDDFYHEAFPELKSFFDKRSIINDENVYYIYFFSLEKDIALNQLLYLPITKAEKKALRKVINNYNSYEEYLKSK